MANDRSRCPGCGALLPVIDGPTHRYIGASPACWAIYSALNAGEPPIAGGPYNGLIVDAYAAQHPGTPSNQATQSVAVHLLTLYGVFEQGVAPADALWVRQRSLRGTAEERHRRFRWLTPPVFDGSNTVAQITAAPTPAARSAQLQHYVESVWQTWAALHAPTLAEWYQRFVVAERI